jgi:7,8-dihydro-6-hydroxymethylpterin dimethyltransferase
MYVDYYQKIMKELEKTYSICPLCFHEGITKKINATIIEDEEKIWISKNCEKHGSFKEIYFGDITLYKKWMNYKVPNKQTPDVKTNLLHVSDLYELHKSQTILTNLVITNRTNLSFDQDDFYAHIAGYIYEPSLIQLRELMHQTRNQKPIGSKSVQLTGGEPTLRDDLFDIIKIAKEVGFSHVQIHTNGIKLAESIEYCRRLKEAEINSIYLRFNGTTNLTNRLIKIHKKTIENLRKVDLNIILNPILIRNENVQESGKIVRFALDNIDIIRGVHFQPLIINNNTSLSTKQNQRKQYVDLIQMLDIIEKEFFGIISREDFFPTSVIYPISQLIEMLIHEPQIEFTSHPSCGGSTFIILNEGKPLPITRFINVETLINFINKESKKKGPLRKLRFATSLVKNIDSFTNKNAPEGFNLKQIAKDAAIGGSDYALRKYHKKTLIIGSMWYQNVWNLDIDRLERCIIHCPTFEGIIPFCSYINLGYGERIQKKYSIPITEWEKKVGRSLKDDFNKDN